MKVIIIALIVILTILFLAKPILNYFKKIKELQQEKIILETNDLRIISIIYKYIFIDFNSENYTICKFSKTKNNEILISLRYDYPKSYKNTLCLFKNKPKKEIYNFEITKCKIENDKLKIRIKNYLLTTYTLTIKINENSDFQKLIQILSI